jgi:hypothetical protein
MSWSINRSKILVDFQCFVWISFGASMAFPAAFAFQNILLYLAILSSIITCFEKNRFSIKPGIVLYVTLAYFADQWFLELFNDSNWDIFLKKLPLLIVLISVYGIEEKYLKLWMKSMAYFSLISAFFLISHHFWELSAIERYQWRPYTYNFLTESLGWQPIYTAISYSFACIYWLDYWQNSIKKNYKTIAVVAYIFLFFVIVLLSTRTALLALLVCSFCILRGNRKWLVVMGLSVGFVLMMFNPILKERTLNAFSGTQTYAGGAVRAQKWKAAWQVGLHFWKTGTSSGLTQIELEKQYQRNGFSLGIENHFNAHQEWLQLWVEGGIWGVLYFLIVSILFLIQWKKRWMVWNILGVILLINSLTESIWERQNGMILFSIVFLIGFVQNSSDKNIELEKV